MTSYLPLCEGSRARVPVGRRLIGAAILAILIPSCALDGDPGESAVAPAPGELHGASEVITEIRMPGDTTLTFSTGEDGVIAVGETAPGDAPSPLSYLVGAQRATPLEIFYSVAAPAAEAPAALLADHARRVAALDGTSAEPRRLGLPRSGAPETTSLAGCDYGNCDEGTNWYYAASCSLASDGQDYFDSKWASLGFNFHWYKSLNTDSIGWSNGYPERSPTVYYNKFYTHLCNYTASEYPVNHYVYWGGNNQWMGAQVHQGYRHVLHLYNASAGAYTNAAYPTYGANGNFKIGAMAGN